NDLGHLQLDIAVDEIIVEDATGFEEVAVFVEIADRLAQTAAYRRNLLQFLRRQVVQVLIRRLAGIELVLDAVEAGHEHRRKAEIWIAQRVGITHLDALTLWRRGERDAAAS